LGDEKYERVEESGGEEEYGREIDYGYDDTGLDQSPPS